MCAEKMKSGNETITADSEAFKKAIQAANSFIHDYLTKDSKNEGQTKKNSERKRIIPPFIGKG